MATATKTAKGIDVKCPFCFGDEPITLDFTSMTCTCGSCSEEFTAGEAVTKMVAMLSEWEAVARWVSVAPIRK